MGIHTVEICEQLMNSVGRHQYPLVGSAQLVWKNSVPSRLPRLR